MNELDDVGEGKVSVKLLLALVALGIPGRVYELFPVAVLIGTLLALARLVLNSEYAVMRTSGVSVGKLAGVLAMLGLVFAGAALVVGEFITPLSEEAQQRVKLKQRSNVVAQLFADRFVAARARGGVEASTDLVARLAPRTSCELWQPCVGPVYGPRSRAGGRGVQPREPQHHQQRHQRHQPASELHPPPPNNTPKSTAP